MKKILFTFLILAFSLPTFGAMAPLSVYPSQIIQGEPFRVEILGAKEVGDVKGVYFDGKKLTPFVYKSKVEALVSVDLNKKPGVYDLNLELKDGTKLNKKVTIFERVKYTAPLGIPESLGGNTKASAEKLVSNLAIENAMLLDLPLEKNKLWKSSFKFPVKTKVVTDPYGYSRETVSLNIAHKGTDFKAKEGTKIYAMNDGIVRMAKKLTVYGNTVVIDHGVAVETFYMHLSKINVKEGEKVKRGQIIGRSGVTGYAQGPHLHLSVRIDKISIDPMKFMELFK